MATATLLGDGVAQLHTGKQFAEQHSEHHLHGGRAADPSVRGAEIRHTGSLHRPGDVSVYVSGGALLQFGHVFADQSAAQALLSSGALSGHFFLRCTSHHRAGEPHE